VLILTDPLSLILSAGGRDTSLTGRDAVWAFAAAAIVQRPILGYGYAAFWSDSDWTLQALHWSPPHAHNGVLQVLLDLGGVGLVLTIALLINTWRRARRLCTQPHRGRPGVGQT
jgi:O-antigen ligase